MSVIVRLGLGNKTGEEKFMVWVKLTSQRWNSTNDCTITEKQIMSVWSYKRRGDEKARRTHSTLCDAGCKPWPRVKYHDFRESREKRKEPGRRMRAMKEWGAEEKDNQMNCYETHQWRKWHRTLVFSRIPLYVHAHTNAANAYFHISHPPSWSYLHSFHLNLSILQCFSPLPFTHSSFLPFYFSLPALPHAHFFHFPFRFLHSPLIFSLSSPVLTPRLCLSSPPPLQSPSVALVSPDRHQGQGNGDALLSHTQH